ncbi:MAG: hypothetical protein LH629_00820 [Ignavibacteria bacterium]|nr:hypothetical protein [Ignavibacteria bacterium]
MKTIINNSKKNSNKTKIIIISMVLLFCSVSKNIYSQLLQYGKSVVTSFDYADLNYNVVRILDIRNRPPFIPGGSQWNPPQAFGANWTKQRMGDVFGITLDNMSPPNIFVSSSSAYCEEPYNLAGLIYRIDGVTGVVTNYINRSNIAGPPLTGNNIMCNTGPDLGNLCFDKKHQQIFATNHEDGIIYRIKDNGSGVGTVQDYYDPFRFR